MRTLLLHDGTASALAQCQALSMAVSKQRRALGRTLSRDVILGAAQTLFGRLLPTRVQTSAAYFGVIGPWFDSSIYKTLAQGEEQKVDFIIACGRSTAPVSVLLRSKLKERVPISVQLLNPRCGPHLSPILFDAIVTPQHDKVSHYKNVIPTVGALTWVDKEALAHVRKEADRLPHTWASLATAELDEKLIVLLGGDTTRARMLASCAVEQVLAEVERPSKYSKSKAVYVIGSRRTPPSVLDALEKRGFLVWRPPPNWGPATQTFNPYRAALAFGTQFIVTADSISMVTEAYSTGRPVQVLYETVFASSLGSKTEHFLQVAAKKSWVTEGGSEADQVAKVLLDRFPRLAD